MAMRVILNILQNGGNAKRDHEVLFEHAAVLWWFSAIATRGILNQDCMMVVLQQYHAELVKRSAIWEKELQDDCDVVELTPLMIAITDRRLVQIAGISGCYDLVQGCMRSSPLPDYPPFEGVSYNLAIPVYLEWHKLRLEHEHDNAKSQRHTTG